MGNETKTLNKERALSRLDDDEQFYKELLLVFNNDVQDYVKKINEHLEGKNYDMLMRCAHSVTSSAGNVGAETLAEMARKTEKAIRENDLDSLNELVAGINSELMKVEDALRKIGVIT